MLSTTRILSLAALAFATTATADVYVVRQQGNSFSPATVNAGVGDVIRYEWTGGSHTVTCGSFCTPDGTFAAPLDAGNPVFEWVIPAQAYGNEVEYFSESGCPGPMRGTIVVNPTPRCPDYNGDDLVDGADLAYLLSAWGTTGQAELDANPGVGASDLAVLLAHWGICTN